nr:hypothetical protein GCM10020092_004990 [Actinoplanes digitatis]
MNVAVIGLGLIGGSLLRALAADGHRVTGYDAGAETREAARAQARSSGSTDAWRVADSIAEAVADTEVAVLAVPLPAIPGVLASLGGYPGLITDVTSVKGPVRNLIGDRRFVGGHPMAGKESSGFAAGDPRLFDGCAWVLCLEPGDTDPADWLALARLFTRLGARVVPVTAAEHDRAVAGISHVPHLLAAALSGVLAEQPAGRHAGGRIVPGRHAGGRDPARADRGHVRRQRARGATGAGRGHRRPGVLRPGTGARRPDRGPDRRAATVQRVAAGLATAAR